MHADNNNNDNLRLLNAYTRYLGLIKPIRHIAQPSLKHGNDLDTTRNNLTILMHI